MACLGTRGLAGYAVLGRFGRCAAATILLVACSNVAPVSAFATIRTAPPVPPSSPSGQIASWKWGHTTVLAKITELGGGKRNQDRNAGSPTSSTSSDSPPDPCWYTPITAIKGDPLMNGDDPSAGVLYQVSCPDPVNLTIHGLVFAQTHNIWVRNGQPVAPPPPDPLQIAQEAVGTMTVPDPVPYFGPVSTQLAVKVPIWLWVAPPPPVILTVAVRGLAVTLTATMTSTAWSMGEPQHLEDPAVTVPTFSCAGAGTPPPADQDAATSPPCGYTYTWKSLSARTNGAGTWPVTVTTNWQVTWTATNGTAGALPAPLTPSTTAHVAIGEWRSSLVAGSGGCPSEGRSTVRPRRFPPDAQFRRGRLHCACTAALNARGRSLR